MPRRPEHEKALTSLRVFRKFIVVHKVVDDPTTGSLKEVLNADAITSRECYELWLRTRKQPPANPEKAFQRSLSAHLAATDGRSPFTPREEAAVLRVIRRKEEWPCFSGNTETRYGLMGFRSLAFHERRKSTLQQVEDHKEGSESSTEGEEEDVVRKRPAVQKKKPLRRAMSSSSSTSRQSENKRVRFDPSASHEDCTEAHHSSMSQSASSSSDESSSGARERPSARTDGPGLDDSSISNPIILSFYQMASTAMTSLFQAGMDAWEMVMNLRRLIVLSTGTMPHMDMQKANEVFELECAKYPGMPIMIADPIAKQPKNRFLLANNAAERWVGKITVADGGVNRSLFPRAQAWTLLRNSVKAWSKPNEEVTFEVYITDVRMVCGKAQMTVRCHPEYGFVVIRGLRLSGGDYDSPPIGAASNNGWTPLPYPPPTQAHDHPLF